MAGAVLHGHRTERRLAADDHPGRLRAKYPAIGRVYLPTASYDEMTEWALPPDLSGDITELKHRLQDEHRDDVLRFVRGGFWRNFLVKYPEVNNMHKKMLRVHEKVYDWAKRRRERHADHVRALDHLWAGQCNCPYWHGVFGGIYLSHIRTANYAELIAAENLVDRARHPEPDWAEVHETDIDKDSRDRRPGRDGSADPLPEPDVRWHAVRVGLASSPVQPVE